MAGSYRHITNSNNDFIGTPLIDGGHGRDAYEALEECWLMIAHLTGGDKQKIFEAWRDGYLAKVCPSNVPSQTLEDFWKAYDDKDAMEVHRPSPVSSA